MDWLCYTCTPLFILLYCVNTRALDLQIQDFKPSANLESGDRFMIYEIRCGGSGRHCSLQDRRSFYQENKCRMLKDFKYHSHVVCEQRMNNSTHQIFKIKHIEINVDARRHKRAVLFQPDPMDMRDFLGPKTYHRFDPIKSYLEEISTRHKFVKLIELGKTQEGRPILAVRIGEHRFGGETPSILIDGGMHAREWITVATAIQIIGRLIKIFKTHADTSCNKVLTALDWYIVPVLNPDGYEYSHETDRFWRKNRKLAPKGSDCAGVDLNRNFEIGYGLGADTNPCSEVYKGPNAHSEPETLALVELGRRLNSTLLFYVSLHAYGQSWLTPWGYKTGPVENMKELEEVAKNAFDEIICNYGSDVPAREYEVGGAADIYYIAGGASDDWIYEKTSTQFAYTIELPDDGREFGFLLPAEQAPQVAEDIWVALKSLALDTVARVV